MQSNSSQARVRIFLSDPPFVLSVCESIEALTGFPSQDWLSSGICLQDRVHPSDIHLINSLFSPDLKRPSGSASIRIRHADGKLRCLRADYSKARAAEGDAVILDLVLGGPTDCVNPALRSAIDRVEAPMDRASESVHLRNPDLAYVETTRRMYPEPRAGVLYRTDRQVIAEGRSANGIQPFRMVDGSNRWIDNRGRPLRTQAGEIPGLFGVRPDSIGAADVKPRLNESREVFHLFIEHAPAAIAMFDRDMRYVAASHRWLHDFGLNADVIGRSHYDVFPEIPDRWKALHRRALAGEDLYCEEDRFVRPDFSIQWLRWEIHPWRAADGGIGGIVIFTEDITQQKKDKENLQLAASVFTNAREGIVICDPHGAILDVNETFTRITGYSRAEVLGRNPRILKSGRQSDAFYGDMWRVLLQNGYWSGEVWNKAKDGRIFPETLTISAVYDRASKVQHYVALFSDVTEAREQERQLERMAQFDALTSLPNRVLLTDRLQQAMAQAHRHGQMLAVACVDLDSFRAVNDQYGQEAGDQLLMAVARRMRRVLGETDTLARIGGDEFVAVLLDLPDVDAVRPILESLLACASQPEDCGDASVQVSASIGVVFYPQTEEIDADQLLRQADQAMYQSKLAGKNRYQIFDPTRDITIRTFHEDLEQIRRALVTGEFVLYYQPRVNMSTGAVVGAEALIRWDHPTRGRLLPALFLPVIENHPLIDRIGEWVIGKALAQLENWNAAGLMIPVSVNIAAHHLQQPDFVDRLRILLFAHPNIRPSCLELEILETSALRDVAQVSHVLAACRELGVSIALDDFGTGYSSLTYFKRLPVNLLKIDRSFVRDVLDDPEDLNILEGVLGLATAFDRVAIAEGVETVDHGRLLLQLGCVYGQGNGIAWPMPGEDLPAWSAAWNPDPAWALVASVAPRKRSLVHAAVAHRAWIAAMASFLLGGRRVPPLLDPHRCRFGRWLDSERSTPLGATTTFEQVDQLHRQIHDRADRASAQEATGPNVADAQAEVNELHRLRDDLLDQMNLLLQDAVS
jgi:diguanylate cyclase (GGDEF)-like protein/PAS domain S-box-containing protein